QLIRAEYSARLQGDALVAGESNWEFTHTPSEPELVVLGECQLALADLQWTSQSTASPPVEGPAERSAQPSSSGAIVGNDQIGRLAARVDRAGTMRGRWSLVGKRGPDGVLTFTLRLPSCPITVLKLILPRGLEMAVDQGQVRAPTDELSGDKTW